MQGDHTLVRDNNAIFDDGKNSRPSRRTIVRAGATAAWTVPVIAMAAPAEATSCSGGTTTLTVAKVANSQSQSGSPKLEVTLQVQVCNTGSRNSTCALSATASGTEASSKLNDFLVSGWTGASTGGGGATSLTVSAPANQQLSHNACTTYQVTYVLHDGSGTHNVTIKFFTSNGATASITVTTTR